MSTINERSLAILKRILTELDEVNSPNRNINAVYTLNNKTCARCGKTGHYAQACKATDNIVPCQICFNNGHIAMFCPGRFRKKKFNSSPNSAHKPRGSSYQRGRGRNVSRGRRKRYFNNVNVEENSDDEEHSSEDDFYNYPRYEDEDDDNVDFSILNFNTGFAKLPRISIKMNGQIVQALIDTGAEVSVIADKLVQKLKLDTNFISPIRATMADGHCYNINTRTNCNMEIQDSAFNHNFLIIRDMQHSCIIGMDFLHGKSRIDLVTDTIEILGTNSKFICSISNTPQPIINKELSMGLSGASSAFQKAADTTLKDLDFAKAFQDDILVFSKNIDEHILHLGKVLERLYEHSWLPNWTKSEFGCFEIDYCGFVISADGMKMNPNRLLKTDKIKKRLPNANGYGLMNKKTPVSFGGKIFTKTEKNYSTSHKELYAIILAYCLEIL